MKTIKKFKEFVINENLNQFEIDKLLDKIGEHGIDSLNQYEKEKLDNIENRNYDPKQKLITQIKELVIRYGQHITMGEMEADSSPAYKSIDQEIHLIESLSTESVGVVSYGGYKYQDELNEYDVKYEELDMNMLMEIKNILDNAIEFEMLDEDN